MWGNTENSVQFLGRQKTVGLKEEILAEGKRPSWVGRFHYALSTQNFPCMTCWSLPSRHVGQGIRALPRAGSLPGEGLTQEAGTSSSPWTFTSSTTFFTVRGVQPRKHRMSLWERRWRRGFSLIQKKVWVHREKQASMQDLRQHKGKITDSTTDEAKWTEKKNTELS